MPLIETPPSANMQLDARPSSSSSPTPSPQKRKRITQEPDELEVDVNAPEPPSKKALRKSKKGKSSAVPKRATVAVATPNPSNDDDDDQTAPVVNTEANTTFQENPSKRSPNGIWIGNLLYTTTKDDLRNFLTNDTNISESMITRIHMPAPTDSAISRQKIKPQNKGFAYIDFSSPETVAEAVALSEKLLTGRRVLIKDAHNFDGRPEKSTDGIQGTAAEKMTSKPPSKRIFVGNLTFDTAKSDMEEHFSQCGEVADVHVATFEDSGKCKGYAWITFAEIGAAETALRGWIIRIAKDDETEDEEGEGEIDEVEPLKEQMKKQKREPPKARKWWVNKLKGRQLRMEFAEDASVRYKKRFGKDATRANDKTTSKVEEPPPDSLKEVSAAEKPIRPPRPPRKIDARKIKPGAALAAAPRLSGGIVASQGKKITFD